MHVAILGFAGQGASTLAYWQALGHDITICDRDETLKVPSGVATRLGDGYLDGLDRFDLLVRTPGIHPRDIIAANGEEILQKVTSNTNEFMRVCPTRNIIGVTGTKGKGTTCTLIARMLEAAGCRVHLGGNIGIPPLELLKANIGPDDYVVLELANFQLIDLKYAPHIAVCLMVEPEHNDWHTGFDEYTTAKQQLFYWQRPEDIAIFYAENEHSRKIAEASRGVKIPYGKEPGAYVANGHIMMGATPVCSLEDIQLLGQHNWQNVCAAVTAAWQITQDTEAITQAVSTFSGLPFRLELVRELDSVKYYNDSFGTTPETAIVAVQAFDQPKVIILGGSDKGSSYTELAQLIKNSNTRAVITIGAMGPIIANDLRTAGFENITEGLSTMNYIVAKARELAQPGDVVLLSTACASFGLFQNYKDRGEQFNHTVMALV